MTYEQSFTSVQTFHTHPAFGLFYFDEMKMKMNWKFIHPGHEEGFAKEEGEGKHQHQHTWPGAGKPWKGKGKEERWPTDTEQDQRRGRTEAPEATYHSETYAYLGTHRTQPTKFIKWDSVQT